MTRLPIFAFQEPADAAGWEVVNDGVMGGLSDSRFVVAPGGPASFLGWVSLDNGGGFASVRSRPQPPSTTGWAGLRVRFRGDGHAYRLTLRTSPDTNTPLYQHRFATSPGVWTEATFPFADFTPTFRGTVLTDVPTVDPARICSVGFLIADRQAGPFQLDVEWIRPVDSSEA